LQFVSRNRDFIRDRAALQRAALRAALSTSDAEAFARRWGLRFRECPHGPQSAHARWTVAVSPAVIAVVRLPTALADAAYHPVSLARAELPPDMAGEVLVEQGR
jgi:hypothetical protein